VTKSLRLKSVVMSEYSIEGDRITLGGLCVRLVLMVNLNTIGMVENVVISEWWTVCYVDRSGLHVIRVNILTFIYGYCQKQREI
jgi:hypothetical protein